jgi:hypothetical protein
MLAADFRDRTRSPIWTRTVATAGDLLRVKADPVAALLSGGAREARAAVGVVKLPYVDAGAVAARQRRSDTELVTAVAIAAEALALARGNVQHIGRIAGLAALAGAAGGALLAVATKIARAAAFAGIEAPPEAIHLTAPVRGTAFSDAALLAEGAASGVVDGVLVVGTMDTELGARRLTPLAFVLAELDVLWREESDFAADLDGLPASLRSALVFPLPLPLALPFSFSFLLPVFGRLNARGDAESEASDDRGRRAQQRPARDFPN